MKKTWLIPLAAISLVVMLWQGGEDSPAPETTAHQKAPAASPRPPAGAPEFAPTWQGGPVYQRPEPDQAALAHRFRPLTEKEKQRMGRNAPTSAPRYAQDPSPMFSDFYVRAPENAVGQYRFRPLEPGRDRYTGHFPQPPVSAPRVPAWPGTGGGSGQVYSYQPPSFEQNDWMGGYAR
jgi:hypothetical protein